MATPMMPRSARSFSQPRIPSLLPPVPCRAITAGSLPDAFAGLTISSGTRSSLPSAFFSVAIDSTSTVRPAASVLVDSTFGFGGTAGRSSSFGRRLALPPAAGRLSAGRRTAGGRAAATGAGPDATTRRNLLPDEGPYGSRLLELLQD